MHMLAAHRSLYRSGGDAVKQTARASCILAGDWTWNLSALAGQLEHEVRSLRTKREAHEVRGARSAAPLPLMGLALDWWRAFRICLLGQLEPNGFGSSSSSAVVAVVVAIVAVTLPSARACVCVRTRMPRVCDGLFECH